MCTIRVVYTRCPQSASDPNRLSTLFISLQARHHFRAVLSPHKRHPPTQNEPLYHDRRIHERRKPDERPCIYAGACVCPVRFRQYEVKLAPLNQRWTSSAPQSQEFPVARAFVQVRQPPGGGSSISLAWGAPEPAPAARRPSGGAAYAPIAEPVAAPAPAAEYAPRFRAAEPAPAAPASAYDMPPRRPSGSAAAPDAGVAGAGAGAPAEVGILPGGGRVSSNAYASGANQNAGVCLERRCADCSRTALRNPCNPLPHGCPSLLMRLPCPPQATC